MTKPEKQEERKKVAAQKKEAESKAVNEFIAIAEPELTKEIEQTAEELGNVNTWLANNANTEDETIAAKLVINRNKSNRLKKEHDKLLSKYESLRNEAVILYNRQLEAETAKNAITGFREIITSIVNMNKHFAISIRPLEIAKSECEAIILNNKAIIERFNKLVKSSTNFKIKAL